MDQKIQLYSLATPNGQKASIALEEMQIPYDAHRIDIGNGDQFKPEFVKINPNSKIPAIVDPQGDEGQPLTIMESGAILYYLAEKSGKFLPQGHADKNRVLQWIFMQVGSVGPMFGQFGHFYKFAKDKCDHPYPVERYANETKRLLGVLESHLSTNDYLVGNKISIADFATFPWVLCLDKFYQAQDILDLKSFKSVNKWVGVLLDRPATQKGLTICA